MTNVSWTRSSASAGFRVIRSAAGYSWSRRASRSKEAQGASRVISASAAVVPGLGVSTGPAGIDRGGPSVDCSGTTLSGSRWAPHRSMLAASIGAARGPAMCGPRPDAGDGVAHGPSNRGRDARHSRSWQVTVPPPGCAVAATPAVRVPEKRRSRTPCILRPGALLRPGHGDAAVAALGADPHGGVQDPDRPRGRRPDRGGGPQSGRWT